MEGSSKCHFLPRVYVYIVVILWICVCVCKKGFEYSGDQFWLLGEWMN